jgi:hypothetical protein
VPPDDLFYTILSREFRPAVIREETAKTTAEKRGDLDRPLFLVNLLLAT